MTRSIIDPVTRIEGHLRVEMEVEGGVVTDAWVSGGCFRGMELVVENRTPEDAAHIVQRICGVCPVSHAHASAIAAEKAYGITIPNNARIIRNLIEGGQFLHSHILWFYTLAALDYVNPINALNANVGDALDLVEAAGTSCQSDLKALKERLQTFANNGQLSIFSGGWFLDPEVAKEFTLGAELDLICTAHYIEALTMQAKSSEICALLGGKMPHIMTLVPGGTSFVPTEEKLDDLWSLVREVRDWVKATMIPDTKAIAPAYTAALNFGKGCGRYIAWGVFEDPSFEMSKRYLPSGVIDEDLTLSEVNEDLIRATPTLSVIAIPGQRLQAMMENQWKLDLSHVFSQLICVAMRSSSPRSMALWLILVFLLGSFSQRLAVLQLVRLKASTLLN